MRYPRKNQYLVIKKCRNSCIIRDILTEEIIELDYSTARFLYKLDGKTDPKNILPNMSRQEVGHLLKMFEEKGLLYEGGRVCTSGWGTIMVALFYPVLKRNTRKLARIWNWFVLVFWLPIFFSGVIAFYSAVRDSYIYFGGLSIYYAGYVIGLIIGMVFHEIGHAAACLAYGGYVCEFGVMLQHFLPAAYVLIDYKNVRGHLKKAQINAAGIEANLLFAGVCFLVAVCISEWAMAWFIAGAINMILAAINLSLIEGIDGLNVLGELLGNIEFFDNARHVVKSKRYRRKISERGINGKAVIMASYIIVSFQIMFPVLIVVNLLSMLGGGL